jgi:hypothetical protein
MKIDRSSQRIIPPAVFWSGSTPTWPLILADGLPGSFGSVRDADAYEHEHGAAYSECR